MKYVLAIAVLLDAAVIFWILRGINMEPDSAQSLIGAAGPGLLVATIGALILVNPTPRLASLARAVALILIVGMLGVIFMSYLAANFESGMSVRDLVRLAALLAVGGGVQAVIFLSAGHVDGRSLDHALGAAIPYGFALWFLGAVFYLLLGFVSDFY